MLKSTGDGVQEGIVPGGDKQQLPVGHVFKEKYNKQNLYHKCPKVNSDEV